MRSSPSIARSRRSSATSAASWSATLPRSSGQPAHVGIEAAADIVGARSSNSSSRAGWPIFAMNRRIAASLATDSFRHAGGPGRRPVGRQGPRELQPSRQGVGEVGTRRSLPRKRPSANVAASRCRGRARRAGRSVGQRRGVDRAEAGAVRGPRRRSCSADPALSRQLGRDPLEEPVDPSGRRPTRSGRRSEQLLQLDRQALPRQVADELRIGPRWRGASPVRS